MILVALLAGAVAAYWAGIRAQRFSQARADVRDNRVKLRKARTARTAQLRSAALGWLALGVVAVLAVAMVLAGAHK